MTMQADLRQVIYALADALDLVGVDDVGHGKRVGVMAAECARIEGLPAADAAFLFDLGLLHDIGVSSTRVHQKLVGEFDWEGSQDHAEAGCRLLAAFPPLAPLAQAVRYHHTRWARLCELGVEPTLALNANRILLVDRVDALMARHYADSSVLRHKEAVRAQIAERAGDYFAPALVDAFLAASRTEAFWLHLEPRSIQHYQQDFLARGPSQTASFRELRPLAEIFARIVDAKSPFTGRHSIGVAGLARLLAERLGIAPDNCEKIEIAGLLHDLGKLRVPDEILDKPGRLDANERMVINTHSFETFEILRNIPGFEEIACWAAYHHEEPDGSGYPFRLTAEEMPLEARILRVADIFQAMVQDRPYRPGLNATAALDFLKELAAEGRVETVIVTALEEDIDAVIRAARPG